VEALLCGGRRFYFVGRKFWLFSFHFRPAQGHGDIFFGFSLFFLGFFFDFFRAPSLPLVVTAQELRPITALKYQQKKKLGKTQ